MTTHADLEHRFTHHPPTPERVVTHAQVRDSGHVFAAEVLDLVPAGREQSLALTAIEEAVMWANAGIARGGPAPAPSRAGELAEQTVDALDTGATHGEVRASAEALRGETRRAA